MPALTAALKSKLATLAKSFFAGGLPLSQAPAGNTFTAQREKTGYPPSRCYGNENAYHCDSW